VLKRIDHLLLGGPGSPIPGAFTPKVPPRRRRSRSPNQIELGRRYPDAEAGTDKAGLPVMAESAQYIALKGPAPTLSAARHVNGYQYRREPAFWE
jgi:hypothetical protein